MSKEYQALHKELIDLFNSTMLRIQSAGTVQDVDTINDDVLSRNGSLIRIMRRLSEIPVDERAEFGREVNRIRDEINIELTLKVAEII